MCEHQFSEVFVAGTNPKKGLLCFWWRQALARVFSVDVGICIPFEYLFVFVIALMFVFVTLEEVWSGTLALYKDSKPRPQWWCPSLTPTLHTALLFTKKQLISF